MVPNTKSLFAFNSAKASNDPCLCLHQVEQHLPVVPRMSVNGVSANSLIQKPKSIDDIFQVPDELY